MTGDPVREIARAVLYEGYLLWPYRRSALKNQQRFTFGGVYPEAFAGVGGDRSRVRMECLLEAGEGAAVEVAVRWLHLVARVPWRREDRGWRAVDELVAGGERHLAWEEATEREASTGWRDVARLTEPLTLPVRADAGADVETLADGETELRRTWQALDGVLEVAATPVAAGVVRLAAALRNTSTWPGVERGEALPRTFLSAHLVARCRNGAFVSATDPPPALARHVAGCRSDGLWPVLAGEPGGRDTMLGSPIILSDHPSVAPESPGDLFDGGEIDALLIHSIRGLTDAERAEMRATDPRTREILDRSLALSPEQMLRLYGAVRWMRRVDA